MISNWFVNCFLFYQCGRLANHLLCMLPGGVPARITVTSSTVRLLYLYSDVQLMSVLFASHCSQCQTNVIQWMLYSAFSSDYKTVFEIFLIAINRIWLYHSLLQLCNFATEKFAEQIPFLWVWTWLFLLYCTFKCAVSRCPNNTWYVFATIIYFWLLTLLLLCG